MALPKFEIRFNRLLSLVAERVHIILGVRQGVFHYFAVFDDFFKVERTEGAAKL